MARRRIQPSSIALPWERQTTRARDVLGDGRWRRVVGVVVLVFAALTIHRSIDTRRRVMATHEALDEVRRAVGRFRADMGRCPMTMNELVHPARRAARYLAEAPVDGWGRPLWVRCPGRYDPEGVDVVSAGPSGNFLVDDNIQ